METDVSNWTLHWRGSPLRAWRLQGCACTLPEGWVALHLLCQRGVHMVPCLCGSVASKVWLSRESVTSKALVACLPPAAGVSGEACSKLYVGEALTHPMGNPSSTVGWSKKAESTAWGVLAKPHRVLANRVLLFSQSHHNEGKRKTKQDMTVLPSPPLSTLVTEAFPLAIWAWHLPDATSKNASRYRIWSIWDWAPRLHMLSNRSLPALTCPQPMGQTWKTDLLPCFQFFGGV